MDSSDIKSKEYQPNHRFWKPLTWSLWYLELMCSDFTSKIYLTDELAFLHQYRLVLTRNQCNGFFSHISKEYQPNHRFWKPLTWSLWYLELMCSDFTSKIYLTDELAFLHQYRLVLTRNQCNGFFSHYIKRISTKSSFLKASYMVTLIPGVDVLRFHV